MDDDGIDDTPLRIELALTVAGTELTFDFSRVHGVPSNSSFSEFLFDIAFSPLFQVPLGSVEVVVGPKAGLFVTHAEITDQNFTTTGEATGLVIGVNAGLFMPVSPQTSLGVLLSFELKEVENSCVTLSGEGSVCSSSSSASPTVIGLTAAALF